MIQTTCGYTCGYKLCPLILDLFLFSYERHSMLSHSQNPSRVIKALVSTSWYLHDLLNKDNDYFDQVEDKIYPKELQLSKHHENMPI